MTLGDLYPDVRLNSEGGDYNYDMGRGEGGRVRWEEGVGDKGI